jgi:hypothetical protein
MFELLKDGGKGKCLGYIFFKANQEVYGLNDPSYIFLGA